MFEPKKKYVDVLTLEHWSNVEIYATYWSLDSLFHALNIERVSFMKEGEERFYIYPNKREMVIITFSSQDDLLHTKHADYVAVKKMNTQRLLNILVNNSPKKAFKLIFRREKIKDAKRKNK